MESTSITTQKTNGAGQTTGPAAPKPRGAIKWTLVFKTSGDDPKFFYTCPCCGIGQQVDPPHMGSVRVRDEFLDEAIYTFGQDVVTLDFAQHVASGCTVKGMSVPGGIVMPDRDSSEIVWLILADTDKGWGISTLQPARPRKRGRAPETGGCRGSGQAHRCAAGTREFGVRFSTLQSR